MVTVREVSGAELKTTAHLLQAYAFSGGPQPHPAPDAPVEDPEKRSGTTTLVAFDGDTPIAAVSAWPFVQNVRGAVVKCLGIAGVATHPGYRRGGHVRTLMNEQHRLGVEAGLPGGGALPVPAVVLREVRLCGPAQAQADQAEHTRDGRAARLRPPGHGRTRPQRRRRHPRRLDGGRAAVAGGSARVHQGHAELGGRGHQGERRPVRRPVAGATASPPASGGSAPPGTPRRCRAIGCWSPTR